MYSLVVSIITQSLKEISLSMSAYKPTLHFFFKFKITKVRFSPLKHDQMTKWMRRSSDPQVSKVHQIPSKSIRRFLRQLGQKFLLSVRMFNCNYLNSMSNFILISWENEAKRFSFLLSLRPLTPNQVQGHWKWYKMVEVNVAHKRDRWEQILLKSFNAMSNIKAFTMQDKQD